MRALAFERVSKLLSKASAAELSPKELRATYAMLPGSIRSSKLGM